MDITQPSVILRASQSCNINTVAITHGRNDSTLRDHPAFFRNITQAHKTRGRVPAVGAQTAAETHKRAWGSPWTADVGEPPSRTWTVV